LGKEKRKRGGGHFLGKALDCKPSKKKKKKKREKRGKKKRKKMATQI